ncbi:MAG: GDP-mannose 4,6-dehydratase, partial [Nocardioides sp.]|uniref:GDP-mannose 4,6-dehydratase n=1 Tax=Nocardioides sp. TaxID=35761 RepID=UPI003F0762D5
MRVLVTGSAGFIGYHMSKRLLEDGHTVLGLDAVTDYYDVSLKEARLAELGASDAYTHRRTRLEDATGVRLAFEESQPDIVIHLAAQAGVRYALEEPRTYVDSNIVGKFNVL